MISDLTIHVAWCIAVGHLSSSHARPRHSRWSILPTFYPSLILHRALTCEDGHLCEGARGKPHPQYEKEIN